MKILVEATKHGPEEAPEDHPLHFWYSSGEEVAI